MKVSIHQVKNQKEYQKALDIRRKVFIEEQLVPEEIEIDAYEDQSIHFIAELNGEFVATGRFRIKENYLKFERVATLLEYRGRGVGKRLMEEMQEVARNTYPEYLPLTHAQTPVIPFYQKLGWVLLPGEFEEAGIMHQTMILPPKDTKKLKCLEAPDTPSAILSYLKTYGEIHGK